jgi:plastocyanin
MMSHTEMVCIVHGMRRGGVVCALVGGLSLASAPALAGDPSPTVVATTDNTFFPKTLTVPPNTTVNWENRGGLHNVKFEDGNFEQPADPGATPWRVSRHFDDAGEFRFYCEMHGGPGGQGMSGTIVVDANADPVLEGLTVKPRRICTKRTRRCKKVRAAITWSLSEDARVTGGIDPVGAPAGRRSRDIEVAGKQGANSIAISGRRYQPGVYKVTLSAEDEDGNESDAVTTNFRVKRARR